MHSSRKLFSQAARTVSCVLGNPREMKRRRVLGLRVRYRRKRREREVGDISRISLVVMYVVACICMCI